jgi:hypothetical protein
VGRKIEDILSGRRGGAQPVPPAQLARPVAPSRPLLTFGMLDRAIHDLTRILGTVESDALRAPREDLVRALKALDHFFPYAWEEDA